MRIELYLSPVGISELYFRDKNVVVIDVLRACTSIAVALKNGAREIIPVENVENAVHISGSLFGDVVLRCGERDGKIIPGFNLGNSPLEYSAERVNNKSLIYTSTNGSQAMVKARFAKNQLCAAFVNVSRVISELVDLNEDITILCSGQDGNFSIEDVVCGGMITSGITKVNKKVELNDAALASRILYRSLGKSILRMLKNSDHGKYLVSIGFADDLKICAETDSVPLLPVFRNGVIKE